MLDYLAEPPVARQSIKVTIGTAFGEGRLTPDANQTGAGLSAATAVTDNAAVVAAQATVAANVATLVADGASPTQAHVTTLNTNWGTLNTAITTLAADVAALNSAITGDVQVTWDTTKVTTVTQLKRAFDAALQAAAGGGILTA